ncbi:MAG: S8 family serine peptidase [Lachnospiraceae bacterium]|nr:S8 family serine peptidase [Lachnospiraceae bacterium]
MDIKRIGLKKIVPFTMALVLAVACVPMDAYTAANNESDTVTAAEAEYVPGEAIVVVRDKTAGGDLSGNGKGSGEGSAIEALGSIPGDFEITELMSIQAPIDDLTAVTAYAEGAPAPLYGAGDGSTDGNVSETICLVKSDQLDTDELIGKLKAADNVISAEPNLIHHLETDEIYEPLTEESAIYEADSAEADEALSIPDQPLPLLADEQTDNSDPDLSADQYMATGEYGIDVPGWNDLANKNAVPESGEEIVVAVVDSGVKHDHADLKNVMWNEGLNYPALTAMGGGKCGFNALQAAGFDTNYPVDDPMDEHHHGTHVAGIIAGEWNGMGVSGIANGAKIMAVRAADARGCLPTSAIILSYNYIEAAIEAGVNVKVINNSWGNAYSSYAEGVAIRNVARNDVVICFASGNETRDADVKSLGYVMLRDLPNVIIVNASDIKGELTSFSNYGYDQTDVAAPGDDIMSTFLTGTIDARYSKGFAINDFDTHNDFGDYTVTGCEAQVTPDGREGNGLIITGSFKADTPVRISFPKVIPSTAPAATGNTKYLSVSVRKGGESDDYQIRAFMTEDTPFNLIPLGNTDGWSVCSHNMAAANWEQTTITLELVNESDKNGNFELYLDDLKFIEPDDGILYSYDSGTSMACPVVAGEAAVLAAAFPDEASDKLAARIKGSVKRSDKLADKCVSGGIANLTYALDDEKTMPVLFSAAKDNDLIKIGGYYFGTKKGTVTLDGTKLTVASWTDNEITARLPAGFQTGVKLVEVHKVTGDTSMRDGHRRFAIGVEAGSENTGDYTYLTPEGLDQIAGEKIVDIASLNGRIYVTTTVDDEGNDRGYLIYEYDPDTDVMNKIMSNVADDYFEPEHVKETPPVIVSNTLSRDGKLVFVTRGQTINGELTEYDYSLNMFDPESLNTSSTPITMYEEIPSIELLPLREIMIADADGELLLIGGIMNFLIEEGAVKKIYRFDEDAGKLSEAGELSAGKGGGKVFTYNGNVYLLYGKSSDVTKMMIMSDLVKLVKNDDGSYTDTVISPKALPEGINENELTDIIHAAVSTYDGGVILTGLPRENSFGVIDTDTWKMNISESGVTFTETGRLFSAARTVNQQSTILDGRYYVLGNTSLGNKHIRFGYLDGYEKAEMTMVNIGDYVVSYKSRVPYTGSKITADDLALTIRSSDGTKVYLPGTVAYKANKAPGTGSFKIKTLAWEAVRDPFTVKKAGSDIKKALANNTFEFNITKRILGDDNTVVTLNKSGKVSALKYAYTASNGKKKLLTVSKKDYTAEDGYIRIKPSCKYYQGVIRISK